MPARPPEPLRSLPPGLAWKYQSHRKKPLEEQHQGLTSQPPARSRREPGRPAIAIGQRAPLCAPGGAQCNAPRGRIEPEANPGSGASTGQRTEYDRDDPLPKPRQQGGSANGMEVCPPGQEGWRGPGTKGPHLVSREAGGGGLLCC
jgi:hypothetical protein